MRSVAREMSKETKLKQHVDMLTQLATCYFDLKRFRLINHMFTQLPTCHVNTFTNMVTQFAQIWCNGSDVHATSNILLMTPARDHKQMIHFLHTAGIVC